MSASGTGSHVHPTLDDPVVASLSEVVGGPVGTRAGGSRWWTPVRALMVITALAFALGLVQKAGCYADGWQDNDLRYTQMCYSDLPYLYTGRGLSELVFPYDDDPAVRARFQAMEYPVGISYFAFAAAEVTHVVSGSPDLAGREAGDPGGIFGTPQGQKEIRAFVIVQALVFFLITLASTWFLAGVNRRRPWDAAIFAVSPMLALTALINWDMLAIVLVAAGLWTWARGKPLATGIVLGLGAATKLYPLFLLGPVAVICIREKRWRDLAWATGGTAGAWLVANAPAYLLGPESWKVFWSFNSDRGADLGSIWLVLQQMTGHTFTPHAVNIGSIVFFLACCAAITVLALVAPRTPRLAQLGFLVIAAFLLVNKVYSPQYVLWLLPLAALARPRWRDQLIWQAGELIYFASVWWYLGGSLAPADQGNPPFYWLAIGLRLAAELYLVVMVVRDVWRPQHDVVDPAPPPRVIASPPAPVAPEPVPA